MEEFPVPTKDDSQKFHHKVLVHLILLRSLLNPAAKNRKDRMPSTPCLPKATFSSVSFSILIIISILTLPYGSSLLSPRMPSVPCLLQRVMTWQIEFPMTQKRTYYCLLPIKKSIRMS